MDNESDKPEFWEANFIQKQEMWGWEASKSALLTLAFFKSHSIKNILIPGFGYGRNAQIFIDNKIGVTGIEISKTAIDIANKHFNNSVKIYHGSVTDMPFDNGNYDGVFCYGLIHLLNRNDRIKLIQDCYNQLSNNGYMIFTAITKESPTYGTGTLIEKDRYEQFGGVTMYFYDKESINNEFSPYGLTEIIEVEENFPFYLIKCQKLI